MEKLQMKNIQKELSITFNTKQQGIELREKYLIPFLEKNKTHSKLLLDMDGCTGFSNAFLEAFLDFDITKYLPEETGKLMVKSDDDRRVKFNMSEYNVDIWSDDTLDVIKFIRRNSLDIGIITLILAVVLTAFYYFK